MKETTRWMVACAMVAMGCQAGGDMSDRTRQCANECLQSYQADARACREWCEDTTDAWSCQECYREAEQSHSMCLEVCSWYDNQFSDDDQVSASEAPLAVASVVMVVSARLESASGDACEDHLRLFDFDSGVELAPLSCLGAQGDRGVSAVYYGSVPAVTGFHLLGAWTWDGETTAWSATPGSAMYVLTEADVKARYAEVAVSLASWPPSEKADEDCGSDLRRPIPPPGGSEPGTGTETADTRWADCHRRCDVAEKGCEDGCWGRDGQPNAPCGSGGAQGCGTCLLHCHDAHTDCASDCDGEYAPGQGGRPQ